MKNFLKRQKMLSHPHILKGGFSRIASLITFAFTFSLPVVAFAQNLNVNLSASDVAENVTTGVSELPGLLVGLTYLLGLVLGVLGILKLKDHVENPSQTPLRTPLIRLAVGGALFALPLIYEAMQTLINNGVDGLFDNTQFTMTNLISGLLGALGGALGGLTTDLNAVMGTFIVSIRETPALIVAVTYSLGLIAGVAALLKLKDHVENPDQTPIREALARFAFGGAMFAIPTIFMASAGLINGTGGVSLMGQVASGLGVMDWFRSTWSGGLLGGFCNPVGTSLGDSICGAILHSGAAPAFLTAMSYMFGLVLVVWGVIKLRDHALNPQQTKVTEGVARLIAGGMFFVLPVTVEAVRGTTTPIALTLASALKGYTDYNETIPDACEGLDGALACFMGDTVGPIHSMLNFFTFTVGMIFIMIGVSRMIKSAQDGPKGPGGLGTMMTFAVGGLLISYNELMRAFGKSFFGGGLGALNPLYNVHTNAELQYTTGIDPAELAHAHTVISAVIKFMIVVGLISFIRGLFIVRSVAEGGQASMMAGVTHLVGGALAVNLGPLINAVQQTLGITTFGITFS